LGWTMGPLNRTPQNRGEVCRTRPRLWSLATAAADGLRAVRRRRADIRFTVSAHIQRANSWPQDTQLLRAVDSYSRSLSRQYGGCAPPRFAPSRATDRPRRVNSLSRRGARRRASWLSPVDHLRVPSFYELRSKVTRTRTLLHLKALLHLKWTAGNQTRLSRVQGQV
jgi:hypothetical protein